MKISVIAFIEKASVMKKIYDSISMIKNSLFINLFNSYDEKIQKCVLVKIDSLI